jgi:primase-polymerase (primpol)-like protein
MNLAHLPEEIRASTRWVIWRYEERAGHLTKVPYIATRPGVRAAVDDPATWCSFAVAVAAVRAGHGAGVGFVLGNGWVGVDLDDVRNARTGVIDATSVEILRLIDSYTEVSPSGTGVHVLAHGTLPPGRRRRGHVEMYDGDRFFTITGWHVPGTPHTLLERTEALKLLHQRVFSSAGQLPPSHAPGPPQVLADDATLIARAAAARNGSKFAALWRGDAGGYPSRSEADLALCNLLAFWTSGDASRIDRLFRASGLMRAKWDARRGTESYGARTIACALRRTW